MPKDCALAAGELRDFVYGSQQISDGLAGGEDWDWATGVGEIRRSGVDAEAVVDRGEQTIAVHNSFDRLFPATVGRADDLTHL